MRPGHRRADAAGERALRAGLRGPPWLEEAAGRRRAERCGNFTTGGVRSPGGGTVVLAGRGNQVGTGAPDVLREFGLWYLVHHYYDADAGGVVRMQIREIEWDDEGWPYFSPDS